MIANPDRYNAREEKVSPGKLHATQYIVVLVLVVLATGMWRLQVLGADSYRQLAEANRIRKDPVRAPRGKIFDREGRILVDNYPSVSCYLLREQAKDVQADVPMIARGLNLPVEQVETTLRRYQITPKYESILLKQDITQDEQAFIEAHRNELPELETRDDQRRLYPGGGFAAHLIGYVGEVSEEDLNSSKYDFYEPGDVVGKSGVEETYDGLLRGTDGSRDVIVNSRGKEVGQLGQLLRRVRSGAGCLLDVGVERLLLLCGLLRRTLVHLPASGDQIDEDAEERQDDDEDDPECLGPTSKVVTAEDVREHDDEQPEPDDEEEETQHRAEEVGERVGVREHRSILPDRRDSHPEYPPSVALACSASRII